jgi:hypothetical protein
MWKSNKPRYALDRAIYYGKEALQLALEHRADIEPRLDAGELDALQSGLPQLEAMETGRPAKVVEVKGLTGSQEDIAEKGHAWVAAIRKAVKNRAEGSGLARAVGVGLTAKASRAKSVSTAIEAVLTAAKERPAELSACGILDSDLARGQAILAAIQGARFIKDDGMGQKKDMTDIKNRTQRAVEKAIIDISVSGNIQYQDSDPALAQRFLDLIPGNGGGNAGGDETPSTGDQSGPKPPETKA